ncbi:MAG: Cu(I)/Ag(I) efflux system membrane fusion protein [Pseudohongiellaceae bacterium]|jgi:Cu(I)/Ag(I) efflux system membrane fusion protein
MSVDHNEDAKMQSGEQHKASESVAPGTAQSFRGSSLAWLIALSLGVLLGRYACVPEVTSDATGRAASDAASGMNSAERNSAGMHDHGESVDAVWTCSMDPQVRQDGPGSCPICGMDLIELVAEDRTGLDPAALVMSENAMALANIATTAVVRRAVSHEVPMVGKVAFDETRLSYITAWVPSRLDRLFVDYTGVSVRKGDHMAEVYSPQLIATQQELLGAVEAERRLSGGGLNENNGIDAIVQRQASSVRSARDRLRLWGLGTQQIDEIVASGVVHEHVTINSPASGVVIHKNAFQGDQVGTGTRIYTIADLSTLWVQLDAYESDLAWLHYGQRVQFSSAAWPGEVREGRISFIDPVLDPQTRTVKVRLNVDNSDGKLKPDMFVHAIVEAPLMDGGRLVDAELAGLFMCPMHPEIVAEEQRACDVCGMALVTTEELGFRSGKVAELPLVIPATAPLITGSRAVVYVRDTSATEPTFVGRVVVLGPRAGDVYAVQSGLQEGEQVVVSGAFKIDSELQIHARPSMMNPAAEPLLPPAVLRELGTLLAPYLGLQSALANDDAAAARDAARQFSEALEQASPGELDLGDQESWKALRTSLETDSAGLSATLNLADIRGAFAPLSQTMIRAFEGLGRLSEQGWGVFHCPMALGEGASWLSPSDEVLNPYFGESMLHCGERLGDLGQRGMASVAEKAAVAEVPSSAMGAH